MKSLIVFILLISLIHTSYSQSAEVDSLKKALVGVKHDTTKCKILSQLAEMASDEEWPIFNNQLKKISETNLKTCAGNQALKIFYTYYLATAINNEGIVYQNQGNGNKALQSFQKSYLYQKSIGSKVGMATAINNVGSTYERIGNLDSALYCYMQSLNYCKESNDLSGEANSLNNIGSVYNTQGNILEALNCFEKSLKISEKNGNEIEESLSLNFIGGIYYYQGEYEKALEYLNKCVVFREKNGYEIGVAEALIPIGSIYVQQKKFNEALACFQKSLLINKKYENPFGISQSLLNIGVINLYANKSNIALNYFFDAYEIIEKNTINSSKAQVLIKISDAYLAQNNLDEAQSYALKALNFSQRYNEVNHIKDASEALVEIHQRKGDYKNAYKMQQLFITILKQINNDETKKAAIKSQFKYEYEKKVLTDSLKSVDEKIIFASKLQQEKTNKYLLILSLVLIILLGLVIFQRVKHQQKLKVSQLRNKIASDLHDDIGSALSSIKMYASIAKVNHEKTFQTDVIDRIEQTSFETIENMSDIVWSINPKYDDFSFVIEKMQTFGNNICTASSINFKLIYDSAIKQIHFDVEQRKNVFLIFKEAVNNAVKYSKATTVSVNISKEGKFIILSIIDNGIGIKPEQLNMGNGLGNMRQRAENMGGTLDINTENGTKILLKFSTT